jgi:hypothetical protein
MAYAQSVAALLWPPPATAALTRRPGAGGDHVVRDWLVLPSPGRPRLLVPTRHPGAARMLARHGTRLGPRVTRAALAAGVRSGLLEHLPVARLRVLVPAGRTALPASVEGRLAEVLGRPVATGVLLGTPRVNRKPVLQVFDGEGTTVAFVKVAHDDPTRALVRREAENLRRVAALGLRTVEAPRVLHHGSFGGATELLVLSVLSSSQERRQPGPAPLPAMAELARAAGVSDGAPLRSTPFWAALRVAGGRIGDPDLAALAASVLARADDRFGGLDLPMGGWHGDWAPWNMGWHAGRVQLWDWERYATGVPVGFDAVHYRAQPVRHDREGLRAAEDALVADLPALLAAFGLPAGADAADAVLVLYLLEIACRYLAPEGEQPANPRHPRARWALALADRRLG